MRVVIDKTIYELELHEAIVSEGHSCMRVAGGWLYTREEPQVNILSSTFVPFSNEFDTTEKGEKK